MGGEGKRLIALSTPIHGNAKPRTVQPGEPQSETNVDDNEYKPETDYYNTSSEFGVDMAIKVNKLNNYMKTHDKQFFVEQFKDDNNTVKFIASQGPNKIMINDFIRMLWEQKTEIVVMLTNLIEEGKVKCESYWPESGKIHFEEITVKLTKTQTFADYTIRKIELEKADEEVRTLTHFHFTSWPDLSTPTAPWALVDFAQKVFDKTTTSPIVVHCSAGQVDFYNTLVKLRKDRIFMIQTGDQYAFLHRAAQVAILCNSTYMKLKDISDRMKDLKQTESLELLALEAEFQSMKYVSDAIRHSQDNETGHVISTKVQLYQNSVHLKQDVKDRIPTIVPRNIDIPYLTTHGKETNDYINAVFVQDHHILTQLPMPTTVTDLWRLVTQYKVSIMVAFETDNISKDLTMAWCIPTVKDVSLSSDYFEVKCMDIEQDELWEEQTLKVRSDKTKSESKDVVHLKIKITNMESTYLLRLVKKIKSYNIQTDGKIVQMCRDGVAYSGLCCVLSNLLDRLDSEFSVSVPLVVRAVKTIRSEVIPDLEQYRVVYEVLDKYSDISTPYGDVDENYVPRALRPVNIQPLPTESAPLENSNVYSNS